MERSLNQNVEPFKRRSQKDLEMIRHIDAVLAEETSLQEGLERAVETGWLSQEEAEACLKGFHDIHINALPLTEYLDIKSTLL